MIDVAATDLVRAHSHLQRLYEVSARLTRFDGVEATLPSVISTVARALELRSAIFILEADGHADTVVWQASGESVARLDAAKAHARAAYGYLVGSTPDLPREDSGTHALPRLAAPDLGAATHIIVLPLVVARRPVFGALQLEGAAGLDELDLTFANAVANQLAVALTRHATTEAKEASLRGKFDFVRDVAESLGEGLLAVDLDGRITLCNPVAATLLGIMRDDAIGRPVATVLEILSAARTPVTGDASPFAITMRHGDSVRTDEHVFATATRQAFPVSYTAAPIRHDGRIHGAVLAFRDIADAKRGEFEQRFLADVSAALAVSLDSQRTLGAVARAAVPGFADVCFIDLVLADRTVERCHVVFADEAKQRQLAERVARCAPRPGRHSPQQQVIESKHPVLVPWLDVIAEDDEHAAVIQAIGPSSFMAVPVGIRDQLFGVVTFVESRRRYASRDLALAMEVAHRTAVAIDNARLYEAAQRAMNARENLLGVVSHDLKSPLSVILMTLDVLRSSDDATRSTKRLETIRRSADRMSRLIEDLLDTASIEAGHLAVDPRRLEMAPIVAEALEALQPLAARTALVLANEVADGLPFVRADANRLHQVIANLVGNAIKFSATGETVRVCGQVVGGELQLSVTDRGPGIAAAELPFLFDRFWQAAPTASQGSGLGLFIVKGIVEAHRGRVWVESTVGVGSTFFVTLPIDPAPPPS